MLALVSGAAGAAMVLLAAQQQWARVSFTPPPPLPAATIAVTGQELVPAADAVGVAVLACLAAILATRGLARRGVGVLLAALGAVAGAAAVASVGAAHVAATAAARSLVLGGAPRVAMAAFPWWAVAVAGGALIAAVGASVVWRGPRWPGMSSRYDRRPRPSDQSHPSRSARSVPAVDSPPAVPAADSPAAAPAADSPRAAPADQENAWDALDRGADPTVPGRRG